MHSPSQEERTPGRPLVRVMVAISRLPSWMRPAAIGALLLAVMTCLRGVFIVALHPSIRSVVLFLGALVIASAGGALAGLAFTIVRKVMAPLGTVGELLTGIVLSCVYVFGILIPAHYWFNDTTLRTRTDWVVAFVTATFFGIVATMAYWGNERKRTRT